MSQSTSMDGGYFAPSRRYLDCASPDFDLRRAASEAEAGASQGDPDAQYLHALLLYLGKGCPQDRKTASEALALSAAAGYRPADIVRGETERDEPELLEKVLELRLRGEQRDTDACRKLFELYDNGSECVKKDHAEAIRFYTVCAENDDVEAQDTIGFMYLMGKGVAKDREKALRWLKAAAENGCGRAMYRIGRMYDEGLCYTEPDIASAVSWYEKAVDADDPDAEFAMGCIHSTPKTRYTDDREAARMFGLAAEHGHAEAQYQIGMLYAYGQGVPRDPSMAVKWLEKSCEGGYQQAMVDFANMSFEGQMVPKDYAKAAKWFQVAADRCSGYYFERDEKMALKYFRDAGEMGEVNSQYCLGCFYYEGRGTEKDVDEAAMWFDQAADQGHPAAKSFLGMFKITGTGCEQDVQEGLRLLNESADTGYYEAQYYLGKLYYEGKYVPKSNMKAKRFLNMAAKQGDPDAMALLNKMKTERSR